MSFEHIERLRREYTDKYVVALVDEHRPELERFRGQTGQVKTINVNGRALVQFDANNNIGWYDIELDYLKIVPAPPPQEEKKPGRKPTATAEAKKDAAAKPAGGATALVTRASDSPVVTTQAQSTAPTPQ